MRETTRNLSFYTETVKRQAEKKKRDEISSAAFRNGGKHSDMLWQFSDVIGKWLESCDKSEKCQSYLHVIQGQDKRRLQEVHSFYSAKDKPSILCLFFDV